MRAEQRIYRTAGGELVAEDDPAAAFLAYPAGEEVASGDEAAVKALAAPADKARRAAANKGR